MLCLAYKTQLRLCIRLLYNDSIFCLGWFWESNASVNSTCAEPLTPYYCLVSPGGGAFANFSLPGGRAFANAGAIPELSNTHAVSHQNKTTQRVLLEKKQIGLSVKDRNKLKRVVRACSRFYACISSLLIKPKLHSETGAIDVNERYQYQYQYYLKNILS